MVQKKAALPNTLRKQNYLAILNTFRGNEALSANDVSAMTGISRATVMKAVANFIEKGLLESAGKGQSTDIGGKKPELFRFRMKRYLLCIGLHGMDMSASVYDLTEKLLVQKTAPSDTRTVEIFLDKIQKLAEELLQEVDRGKELLYGVSLFIGGVLDAENGVLRYSVLTPEWGYDIPLKKMLSERFPGAVIVIDNVARMAACAAVLDNTYYEEKRVAVIYTDVDASACYIDRGTVLHGPNSMIGEIGPMVISLGNTVPYTMDENSYFSTQVDEERICGKVLSQPEKLKNSILETKKERLSLYDIFMASEEGDELAREVVKEIAWSFSAALHNIVLNFDPEIVILQGKYAFSGKYFAECMERGLACFPRNAKTVSFQLEYDKRPLISLQMMGATKVLTRKFFSSSEWIR